MDEIIKERKKKRLFITLFVVSLVLLLISSSVLSYFLIRNSNRKKAYATTLQNSYARNFTELSSTLNEVDVNLSKLLASSTNLGRQKILLKIWKDCSACQANLSSLPTQHESISSTLSFVNRLGEYCYYLSTKLISDTGFSSDDFANIAQLDEFANVLSHDIALLSMNVVKGNFDLLNNFNGVETGDLANFLNTLNETTVETPSMIYDGPYSESQTERQILGLSEQTCTAEEAKRYVAKIFDLPEDSINFVGETVSGFETYNFEFNLAGEMAFAQITKRGCFLLALNKQTPSGEQKIDVETAIQNAKAFFEKLGIKNMEANWKNVVEDEILINFAPKIDGAIIYSDLIKVKVSRADGMVCGFEAISYAYNHHDRQIKSPLLTQDEAKEIVSNKLSILSSRLCIIPKEYSQKEVLAYEFECVYNTYTYYVYVNAETGVEEEVFRVVQDENEGELVL